VAGYVTPIIARIFLSLIIQLFILSFIWVYSHTYYFIIVVNLMEKSHQ